MNAEYYRELKEKYKVISQYKYLTAIDFLKKWEETFEGKLIVIAPWHLRFKLNGITLDIFPKTQKYHNVTADKRGRYHIIARILEEVFFNITTENDEH